MLRDPVRLEPQAPRVLGGPDEPRGSGEVVVAVSAQEVVAPHCPDAVAEGGPRPDGAGRALPHFTRAVELNPRYGDARYWLAESLEDLGRTDEAVVQFDAAIQLHTNFLFQTQNDLGVTLANAGQLAAALPHFEEAVRLNPRVASVQLMLAQALGPQEAQAHYQEALRLDPRLGRPSGTP